MRVVLRGISYSVGIAQLATQRPGFVYYDQFPKKKDWFVRPRVVDDSVAWGKKLDYPSPSFLSPWDGVMSDYSFQGVGASVVQRDEHQGRRVPFAGHSLCGVARVLGVRLSNPNVVHDDAGTDTYQRSKIRFVPGSAYCSTKEKEGHAYGHMNRAVDSPNVATQEWLSPDLLYMCIELVAAGWSVEILAKVLGVSLMSILVWQVLCL